MTADTAQHPDVSEISDLTEGLLPPPREAALRRHIDACAECGHIQASLEEIRSLLGAALPLPGRMPDDIANRIDAALSAEAATPDAPATANPVSRETFGLPAQGTVAPPPAGRPRGGTGPGRGSTRRRRRTVILGTAFGAAAVGMSVLLLQSLQSSQGSSGTMADRGVSAAKKSQGDFSEGTLEGRVHTLLTEAREARTPGHDSGKPSLDTKASPGSMFPGDASPRTPLRTPVVVVPPCVLQGTGRDAPALALEKGSYEGTAAFLVVLPHSTDSSRVQAYVVDAACVDSTPATKGQLLLTHSYTRP
ncbi:zf-HC2 domain-containing protein [Streptomyces atroolivaceus]|uniref:Anti-sigma factor family protein n=1 Tax=Streptomyces atroolivaceus TaxID=66869 RepID=A0ABV9V839_STRAZ|nr:zf-HC2 domain-containing protein [Streptomyces atroolivaceus]